MSVIIEYESGPPLGFDYEDIISRVIDIALDFQDCKWETRVNVFIVSDDEMRRINYDYREIDKTTDVLSFPLIVFDPPGDLDILDNLPPEDYFDPDSGELLLGDIILSADRILFQAESYGHSPERELGFLVAHSMLHLFGYDHVLDADRILMEEKQRDILTITGLNR